jgi:hypothetical protein
MLLKTGGGNGGYKKVFSARKHLFIIYPGTGALRFTNVRIVAKYVGKVHSDMRCKENKTGFLVSYLSLHFAAVSIYFF